MRMRSMGAATTLHSESTKDACGSPRASLALDIGGTKIAGAVVLSEPGAAPRITVRETVPTDASRGGEAVLATVVALSKRLAAAAGTPLAGIGVSTAGRVDANEGNIAYANEIMPGWTGQPVRKALEEALEIPAAVLNDVQAHALGEARWGAGRGAQTCIVVAAGTGLGGGIITNGRILRGMHGFAGEIGCTPNPLGSATLGADDGIVDLEMVAAGAGIERCYRNLTGRSLTGAQISQAAASGEDDACRIIRQAGYALGVALAGWTNMLDPELVILSGSVAKAGALWRDAVDEGFADRISPVQANLPIVDAQLGSDAPLVGATEFLLDVLTSDR